ncbi:MAG: hypothetical protein QM831_15155 [Kofleriaceae bacterium]
MRLLLPLLCFGACAQAGKAEIGGHTDAGSISTHDSSTQPLPDAFVNPIDAPPGVMTKTLDENTSDTVVNGNTQGCSTSNGFTAATQYWRVYNPANFQITTDFHITQVGFTVEDAETIAGNGQQVTVKVGIYDAPVPTTTFDTSKLMGLAQDANVQVAEGFETPQPINVPLSATIPAGKNLFIEIDSLDGINNELAFWMGSSNQTDSSPSWMKVSCINGGAPITTTAAHGSQSALVMTVTGQY